MHEGQIPTGNRRNRIGVSWFSNTSSLEDTLVGHGGEVNGHSCNMLFSPTHDVGIIVMSNIGGDNIFPFSDWLVNQVINDYRNQMIPSIDEATDAVFAGRWSDAVWANRNILKHNKDDVEARHRLGVALFYLRRIAEAKQELEKIPDDQDNDGYAEMMLSRIAVIQGDSKGAIGHLDKAIINGFEDHYFVQNLSEFSILRDSKPFRDLMNRIN